MSGQTDWKEIEAKLITLAWEDDAFKATLLSDPRAAIKQAGLTVPEDVEIKVVEETPGMSLEEKPGVRYLLLPAKPEGDESEGFELSEEELTTIRGGVRKRTPTVTTYPGCGGC